MTEAHPCPRCGRALPDDAPQGLCPACLIAVALADSEETNAQGTGGDADEATDAFEGHTDPSGDLAGAGTAPASICYYDALIRSGARCLAGYQRRLFQDWVAEGWKG